MCHLLSQAGNTVHLMSSNRPHWNPSWKISNFCRICKNWPSMAILGMCGRLHGTVHPLTNFWRISEILHSGWTDGQMTSQLGGWMHDTMTIPIRADMGWGNKLPMPPPVNMHTERKHQIESRGPFYLDGLTLIPAWISNHIVLKM